MSFAHTICVIGCVFAIAAGQLLFKRLGIEIQAGASLWSFRVYGLAVAAFTIYCGATFLWIYVLRYVALSKAYQFMALSFVIIPVASYIFFQERLTIGLILGSLLIVLGICVAVRFG
jgi:drug/metabolite transporter (DMT)-like permease